ncbi:hypothetical protein [Bradyrhizobium monzae]|uniref:hypothetical protein n=1 Tax=Bradyrhizobium sp. Oc8 TaxID=2876780 RepID=UPI001F3E030C|nr:hypothetical protein [Bradyrhizobium sp. Oc8]
MAVNKPVTTHAKKFDGAIAVFIVAAYFPAGEARPSSIRDHREVGAVFTSAAVTRAT